MVLLFRGIVSTVSRFTDTKSNCRDCIVNDKWPTIYSTLIR